MRYLLTLFTLCFCTLSIAQTISRDLYSKRIYNTTYKVVEETKDGDASKYVVISYRNQKYQQIDDMSYTILKTAQECLDLQQAMNDAIGYIGTGTNYETAETHGLMFRVNRVVFMWDDEDKSTRIQKGPAKKMAAEFGKMATYLQ
jgi:hypothetical protein